MKYPNELNPPSARSHTVNIHCSNQRSPLGDVCAKSVGVSCYLMLAILACLPLKNSKSLSLALISEIPLPASV